MHGFDDVPPIANETPSTGPWYSELTRYHWFVLGVAALGWLFDTMDQQLFTLARAPAMRELLTLEGVTPSREIVAEYGGYATAIFLIGWATGGLGFGILGDRIGRAKTMMWTILIYSACTGLSALSWDFKSFAAFRFLTGLGVGGEFAVGVSLVAEVMPNRARPFALGLLQALSAIGNISAAVISMELGYLEETEVIGSAWKYMFVIGTLPALLAVLIRRRLKEPERWQAATGEALAKKLGSYTELFGDPRWRKNALVGMTLAFSGVVGLWGIGFFAPDLNRLVFRKTFLEELRQSGEAEKDREFVRLAVANAAALTELKPPVQTGDLLSLSGGDKDPEMLYAALLDIRAKKKDISVASVLRAVKPAPNESTADQERRSKYLDAAAEKQSASEREALAAHAARISKRTRKLDGRLTFWAAVTSIMLNLGAFFGIYAFSYITAITGRKPAFAVAYVLAGVSTATVFWNLNNFSQIFWMVPIMGFCQLSLFGGFAIYFPELFPTHLRSTGTSFCYNVGRFVAAAGPYTLGKLTSQAFAGYPEPMRYAGVAMCSVFLIGLLALPFAPETKGRPLPE